MTEKLKPCPFCGEAAHIEKVPLWHGSHGYLGYYCYDIRCTNSECRCSVYLGQNDTIYSSDAEAEEEAIKHWNRRVNDEPTN